MVGTATALAISLLLSAPAFTQQLGKPCMFDANKGEVPDCVRPGFDGGEWIDRKYVRQLTFRGGLAAVYSEGSWMYVNRSGLVIVGGVPIYDNGPDEFHDGLVRFVRDGKYGFANRKGRIVIPARYDGAMVFQHGHAEVCRRCELKRDADGHGSFVGGEWFWVDKKGRETRKNL